MAQTMVKIDKIKDLTVVDILHYIRLAKQEVFDDIEKEMIADKPYGTLREDIDKIKNRHLSPSDEGMSNISKNQSAICECGDHTRNKDKICDTWKTLKEMDEAD